MMNIMKHIYLQILALLSVLSIGLASCSKSEQGMISFDTPEISAVSSAGTVTFIVRSNTTWTLEPSCEWITLNILKGRRVQVSSLQSLRIPIRISRVLCISPDVHATAMLKLC